MSTVSVEVAVQSASQQLRRTGITRLATRSILAACVVLGCAITASAATQDDGIGALRSYVTEVAAQAPLPADASIAALKEFVSGVPAAMPVKVAEADNLFDALQQWSSGQSGSAPAAPPAAAPAKRPATKPVREATLVDNKVCLTCHATQAAEFEKTLMGKIGKSRPGMFDCQNCHGAGSEHVKLGGGRGVGGILSFEADDPRPVKERNAICLGCHEKGDRTYWQGSVHQTRDVACTNCHTVMKNVSRKSQLKTVNQLDTCFQCHKLQRAQFQYSSHMPAREGKMVCSDCHNPHGSPTEKLLRASSTNELCYKCHAEKRGPMLWEHQPVRENCTNCHSPHGSNYENLLVVARPRLCHNCHTMAHNPTTSGGFGYPNTAYVLQNACGNCHSAIHGSNHPNGMFLLR